MDKKYGSFWFCVGKYCFTCIRFRVFQINGKRSFTCPLARGIGEFIKITRFIGFGAVLTHWEPPAGRHALANIHLS